MGALSGAPLCNWCMKISISNHPKWTMAVGLGLVASLISALILSHLSGVDTPVGPADIALKPQKEGRAATGSATEAQTRNAPPSAPTKALPAQAKTGKPVPKAEFIMNLEESANDREEAMYQLTQKGMAALPELKKVLANPLPADPTRHEFEVSLRITALEALDELSMQGADIAEALQGALATYDEPSIQTLAMVGLQGLEENRPGKINRFIDKMVN